MGIDFAASCDEQCCLHGGVCEFWCSNYVGYTCQNNNVLFSSISMCGDVLVHESKGQDYALSEGSILQQLEAVVVMPNYSRLFPTSQTLFAILENGYCAKSVKRLAFGCVLHIVVFHFSW